jgi:hypothetical protein
MMPHAPAHEKGHLATDCHAEHMQQPGAAELCTPYSVLFMV